MREILLEAAVPAQRVSGYTVQSATATFSPSAETADASLLPAKIRRAPPVPIDQVLTKDEFLALIEHMGNDNPVSHFLTIWRDDDGNARYAKAKPHKQREKHARWTYDAITGKSKQQTAAMGLYPKNQDNKSTWGALDFDAHTGGDELAKNRSIRAFSLLLEYRDRYLLLSASGRGYHVFVFAREPRPVKEWVGLLKDTCDTIDAPIQDGVCEIFPNDRAEKQVVGRAIRVPGAVNPSTGKPEMILADTIRPLLDHLASAKRAPELSSHTSEPNPRSNLYEYKEAISSFTSIATFQTPSTKRLVEAIIVKYSIKLSSARHTTLMKLVGELFRKFGRGLSEKIIRQHYELSKEKVSTPLSEHLREFGAAWDSFLGKELGRLSASERRCYDQCSTEPQQEAFMLIRSFAAHAKGKDFQVAQVSLADRLEITQQGAGYVIERLQQLGAIKNTVPSRKNIAARYRWIL